MAQVLSDPRFGDFGRSATSIGRYATEVKPIWEAAFKDRTREEIIDLVKSVGGDAVPIMDYPSLLAHPQVDALGAIVESDHPTVGSFKTIRPVACLSETPDAITSPPPTLGQHTAEVLRTLGMDDAEIERLRMAGVIATG
jgi:formyl-CoA transferase